MTTNFKGKIIGICLTGFGIYVSYVLMQGLAANQIGFVGKGIYNSMFFLFGQMSYALPMLLFVYSSFFIFKKNIKINKIKIVSMFIFFFMISSILIITQIDISQSQDEIIREILKLGGNNGSGGMVGAVISIVMFKLFGKNGGIILNGTILFLSGFIMFSKPIYQMLSSIINKLRKRSNSKKEIKQAKKESKKRTSEKKKELKGKKIDEEYKQDEKQKLEEKKTETNNQEIEEKRQEKKTENLDVETNINSDLEDIFMQEPLDKVSEQKIEESIQKKAVKLEETLKNYNINVEVKNYVRGPVITRFEISVESGTRVRKISNLANDIAMNLEAKSIRIEAPIPGKNAVGIEIPNEYKEAVYFSTMIKTKEYKKVKSPISIILGKNIVGDNVIIDLAAAPHLLIAGRTGSGKSVCINTLISSIVKQAKPEDVRFIMVDPKMVELMPYNGIPHLLVPVIIDPKQAAVALKWTVNEMEDRYKKLAATGSRNIIGYNKIAKHDKLNYIVVIIDELADLMMVAPGAIEESIARIAQKARAVGIHLVVATQRPSTDVITGTIKANLPSRISFAVASQIDSRTILDTSGAEKLLGKGDMLYLESGKPNLVRIQGAFISDDEVNKFTKYLKEKGKPIYNDEIITESLDDEKDELYDKAVLIIKAENKVSTSLIQRKLKIGYSRAARIMDQLEDNGIISSEKEILIDV